MDVFVSVYTLSIKKLFRETFWFKFFVPSALRLFLKRGGESTQDWLCVGMWGCQKVHKRHKKGVCEFFKSKTYFMENYKKCNSFNKIWQIPLVFQILRRYHHIESVELNSRLVICLKIIKLSYVLWITKQCSGLVCQFTMGK